MRSRNKQQRVKATKFLLSRHCRRAALLWYALQEVEANEVAYRPHDAQFRFCEPVEETASNIRFQW